MTLGQVDLFFVDLVLLFHEGCAVRRVALQLVETGLDAFTDVSEMLVKLPRNVVHLVVQRFLKLVDLAQDSRILTQA